MQSEEGPYRELSLRLKVTGSVLGEFVPSTFCQVITTNTVHVTRHDPLTRRVTITSKKCEFQLDITQWRRYTMLQILSYNSMSPLLMFLVLLLVVLITLIVCRGRSRCLCIHSHQMYCMPRVGLEKCFRQSLHTLKMNEPRKCSRPTNLDHGIIVLPDSILKRFVRLSYESEHEFSKFKLKHYCTHLAFLGSTWTSFD